VRNPDDTKARSYEYKYGAMYTGHLSGVLGLLLDIDVMMILVGYGFPA
jgi:hypothetical protein